MIPGYLPGTRVTGIETGTRVPVPSTSHDNSSPSIESQGHRSKSRVEFRVHKDMVTRSYAIEGSRFLIEIYVFCENGFRLAEFSSAAKP